MPSRELVRARVAVAVLFFSNGLVFANLLPHYPGIKADLGLGDAAYGLAVAAFRAGALAAGLFAGGLVRRFTSRAVAVTGMVLAALALLAAGVAPAAWVFALALFLAGAADAITDVGQNAHGLRVERVYGRSIINSFHAVWSLGAVTGGLMAAGALAGDIPRGIHLSLSTLLVLALVTIAHRFLLPGPDVAPATATGQTVTRNRITARTVLFLLALVLVGVGAAMIEDVASSWAALYLRSEVGAAAAVAAFGYVAIIGGQLVGRLLGDGMVERFGQRLVGQVGGVLIAAGFSLALAADAVALVLLGFAASGFGMATLIPGVMATADKIEGLKPSTGLTLVAWLMRIGGLVTSPLIGALSTGVGLRAALLVVPVVGLLVLVSAGVMAGRRR